MTSGIYEIKNLINGNIYIGSALNIGRRWSQHMSRLSMGNHHSIHLQRAWNKYGENAFDFSVIEECEVQKLIEREQYFIDTLLPQYNICKIAGSSLGIKRSVETKVKMSELANIRSSEHLEKISASLKGRIAWNKGKTISDETREKIRLANIGKILSVETRTKLSAVNKERWARKKASNR